LTSVVGFLASVRLTPGLRMMAPPMTPMPSLPKRINGPVPGPGQPGISFRSCANEIDCCECASRSPNLTTARATIALGAASQWNLEPSNVRAHCSECADCGPAGRGPTGYPREGGPRPKGVRGRRPLRRTGFRGVAPTNEGFRGRRGTELGASMEESQGAHMHTWR